MTELVDILAATARLEEQAKGTRRDIAGLQNSTTTAFANHERRVSSLERSRATWKGWMKGLGGVGLLGAVAGFFFRWG